MAAKDKELIERLAMHMADELGRLGHHKERWYSTTQRRDHEAKAKNIITLLRNDGFTLERR